MSVESLWVAVVPKGCQYVPAVTVEPLEVSEGYSGILRGVRETIGVSVESVGMPERSVGRWGVSGIRMGVS